MDFSAVRALLCRPAGLHPIHSDSSQLGLEGSPQCCDALGPRHAELTLSTREPRTEFDPATRVHFLSLAERTLLRGASHEAWWHWRAFAVLRSSDHETAATRALSSAIVSDAAFRVRWRV